MDKKIKFVCSLPDCQNQKERYLSQVRNINRLYCSIVCKGLDEVGRNQGEDNPNFRHGRYIDPTCDCGEAKDERSNSCATCSGVGFKKGRKPTRDEILGLRSKRTGYIREYVLKHDLLPYLCECGQGPEWMGKILTLELDHKNGNPADNRLENLRFLCPNCHNTTPTFGSRNRRK